jgi:L-ascorbate metabolism protein UlaG (beta-lactamase superfamily)
VLVLAAVTAVCAQTDQTPSGSSAPATQTGAVTVTYVGNEGVLISHGGKSVLIDGLHREYGPAYLFPPPGLLGEMESARPPFGQIRAVLVTHVHLDHFHPESVGLHLKNNPKAVLISSAQAMLEIGRNFSDHESVRGQMREVTPEWKRVSEIDVDGIKVKVLGMRHGGDRFWWMKNLGYIVEIGGKKFFHFGDADTSVENFSAFELPKEKIEVAFVPYWFLLSEGGRQLVRERIGATANVAVHIPPQTAETDAANIVKLFPGVMPLTKLQQTIEFK